jgi:hypothetical protein
VATPCRRGEAMKRRKEIYLAMHPETRNGGDRGNQHTGGKPRQNAESAGCQSFTEDTAAKGAHNTGPLSVAARDGWICIPGGRGRAPNSG